MAKGNSNTAKRNDKSFHFLSVEEAEEVVRELGRALDTHRDWSRIFQTMLVCRTKPSKGDLDKESHKQTVFGNWYHGHVNPHLKDHPDFKAVGKHSKNMHDTARKLAQITGDGGIIKPAQYKTFITNVDKFRKSLRALLSEAWDYLRYIDPLTGVMTRTAMQTRLEGEHELSRRNGVPCCIGMMDLDHFKDVNDTHGHQAGDEVLKSVSEYIASNLRRYDQIFRYGGEEFLLLLPNTTPAAAKTVLDRLRRGIKNQKVKIGARKTVSVSASFGVARLLPELPVKDSLEHADQALYVAKEAGRNKVCIADDGS